MSDKYTLDDIYIYTAHGSRTTGTEENVRATVIKNTYVTLTIPGNLNNNAFAQLFNYLIFNKLSNEFITFVTNFEPYAVKNKIYKTDIEYKIITHIIMLYLNGLKKVKTDAIPFNTDPNTISMKHFNKDIFNNKLFNYDKFLEIKDNIDYHDEIVMIFNKALQEMILTQIYLIYRFEDNWMQSYVVTTDIYMYDLLQYILNDTFINVLDNVDEINIFIKYIKQNNNYDDYNFDDFVDMLRPQPIQPDTLFKNMKDMLMTIYTNIFKQPNVINTQEFNKQNIVYKYFNNLRQIFKNINDKLKNINIEDYHNNFIEINKIGIKMNIYDLLLKCLNLDIRIYKPYMTIPLFKLSPFHHEFENGFHNIWTKDDKVGLYQMKNGLIISDTNYQFKQRTRIAPKDFKPLDCNDYGAIYDNYYKDKNIIYPSRDDFIKYGKCKDGNFMISHFITQMMEDVSIKNKIIIIEACAVFNDIGTKSLDKSLRRALSDRQQKYVKYLKYKTKYLKLKTQLR